MPKVWIAHDCGRAISPVQVEGQIEGSTYMGVAELQMEEQGIYTDPAHPEAFVGAEDADELTDQGTSR